MTNNQKKKKQSPNLLKNKNHVPKKKSCLVKPKTKQNKTTITPTTQKNKNGNVPMPKKKKKQNKNTASRNINKVIEYEHFFPLSNLIFSLQFSFFSPF